MTTEPTVSVEFPEPLAQELSDALRHEVEHADEHHSTETVFATTANQIETALEETTNAPSETWTHPHWEYGTACPTCGCDTFNVVQASGEKYRSESGELIYVEPLPYREELHVSCDGCETVVYSTDAYSSLHSD